MWPIVHAELLWILANHNAQFLLHTGRGQGDVDDMEGRKPADPRYSAPATKEEQ